MPLVCKVLRQARLKQSGWLAYCDILRSSKTLHVDPDRPREFFGAISLQSCDARQGRLTSQPAGRARGSAGLVSIV